MTRVDIHALVRRVPGWEQQHIDLAPLHGGITNTNFVATVDGQRAVVRVPGERTELLGIDRANEAEAAIRAAELGIGPAVLGKLPDIGTLITALVPGRHLEPTPFTGRLPEVVELLRTFHDSGPLQGGFPIHRVVEWHARDASSYGVVPPTSYGRLHQQSRRIEAAFAAAPLPTVPCHNDLLPGNLLFEHDGDRVWLLDFEYAGMNDRFFDLGNLSVNCGLDTAGDQQLLRLYFGEVTPSRWARLQLMKMMSEFREGMWAVVQQAISTLDTDFAADSFDRDVQHATRGRVVHRRELHAFSQEVRRERLQQLGCATIGDASRAVQHGVVLQTGAAGARQLERHCHPRVAFHVAHLLPAAHVRHQQVIAIAAQPDDGDLWRAVTIDGDEVAVHTAIDRGPQLRMQLHDRRVDAERAGPHALQARGRPVHDATATTAGYTARPCSTASSSRSMASSSSLVPCTFGPLNHFLPLRLQ